MSDGILEKVEDDVGRGSAMDEGGGGERGENMPLHIEESPAAAGSVGGDEEVGQQEERSGEGGQDSKGQEDTYAPFVAMRNQSGAFTDEVRGVEERGKTWWFGVIFNMRSIASHKIIVYIAQYHCCYYHDFFNVYVRALIAFIFITMI